MTWTPEQNAGLREDAQRAHDHAAYYGVSTAIHLSPNDALSLTERLAHLEAELHRLRSLAEDSEAVARGARAWRIEELRETTPPDFAARAWGNEDVSFETIRKYQRCQKAALQAMLEHQPGQG